MTLTSLSFFGFVFVALVLYYLCPKKYRWAVLLTASYVFYLIVCAKYVVFLIVTTISTWAGALVIGRISLRTKQTIHTHCQTWDAAAKKQYKKQATRQKRGVLAAVLLFNFGILGVLKYYNFFADSISSLFGITGISLSMPTLSLLLPLGISFYTFQATGYLIDVYRDKVTPAQNPAKFALFVSFFPQIVQGPIGFYSDLAHQLYEPHTFSYDNLKSGFQLILWGMFKKLVIADRLVIWVETVSGSYESYPSAFVLTTVLVYALQLYADFSGGIDISRGVAELFGIRMAENFRRPYFATSISDYWRRWHITLGAWLREYLFFPLAMSGAFQKLGKCCKRRLGKHLGKTIPASLATVIVFLVIGIWHGANWKYVGFGLWNGLVIMLSNLLAPIFQKAARALHLRTKCFSFRLLQMARTFLIVLVGYYFDIAHSFTDALQMMKRSLSCNPMDLLDHETFLSLGLYKSDCLVLAVSTMLLFAVSLLQETRQCTIRQALDRQNIWFQWAVMLCGIFGVLLFGVYGPGTDASEFVYMQF